jgi:multiple sugar transport system permease protein
VTVAEAGAVLTGRRSPGRPARRKAAPSGFGVALLSPALLLIGLLLVVPLCLLLLISFKAVKLGGLTQVLRANYTWANYLQVLDDAGTWHSLMVSGAYILGSSALAFATGLGTALLVNEKLPAQRLFRTLVLLPWAVPGITATVAFLWIMQPSFGVLNFVLRSAGLITDDLRWFGDSRFALLAVTLPTVWKTYPFFVIMILAALQAIPPETFEAAAIDGARGWQRFRWITWPSIRRHAVVALVFNAMYVFREFDFIYASTRGGPQDATDTVSIRIYNIAFESFDLARASALGVLTFLLVASCVYQFIRWQARAEVR